MSFLKRLFGLGQSPAPQRAPFAERATASEENIFTRRPPNREATNRYFDSMAKMQGAISDRKYDEAARIISQTLDVLEPWLKEDKGEYGQFLISSIPVFEQGARILAYLGRDGDLAEMEIIVNRHDDFGPWRETIAEHRADQARFARILEIVDQKPGTLQTDMKQLLGEADGRRIASLLAFLEKSGCIDRQKAGKTYKLVPAGMKVDAGGEVTLRIGLPQAPATTHRRDKAARKPRNVNFAEVERIPLPRSPVRWELDQASAQKSVEPPKAAFEVRDAPWRILAIDKLAPEARPDPAFRQLYPTASGLLLVDDLGNAEEFSEAPAAVLRFDLDGQLAGKAALTRDVYRFSAHPLGDGFVMASKDAVLQVYGSDLKLRLETALALAPEVLAVQKRLGIADAQLKNHIRCVALSPDGTRYLVTVVDEAWCVTMDGEIVWGVKMPVKEGYSPAGASERQAETSDQVSKALATLGLALPIAPDDVKRRYRELAKQYHPDLNGGDQRSLEKMKELNLAVEAVTGLTAEAVPEFTGVRYTKELQRSTVKTQFGTLNISMQMVVSESFAADWVYAAAFGADPNSAYLATYTGRVVRIDGNGLPKRSYEIGAVPKAIVDTGDYLYIQTDTRLYVIRGAQLHRLLDIYDGGDLIVWKQGFGLLEKKRFRWFSPDGTYRGGVVSKDPLRRVFWNAGDLVIETRQTRVRVALQ
jgi:hypothetical protein